VTVDVRDMLCAQALAVAAQAGERLPAGSALQILYNTQDVRRDLLSWARERGWEIEEPGPGTLRLRRRGP
jgi:TusA-related sulfurtransferase